MTDRPRIVIIAGHGMTTTALVQLAMTLQMDAITTSTLDRINPGCTLGDEISKIQATELRDECPSPEPYNRRRSGKRKINRKSGYYDR